MKRPVTHPIGQMANLVNDALAQGSSLRQAQAGHEDDEFIAPHAPHVHARLQQRRHPGADLAQHLVAGVVAKQVIDQLEAIQIQIGQCQGRAGLRGLQRPVQLGANAVAVEHLGQRVMVGQELQALRGQGALGHVLQRAFDACAGARGLHQETASLGRARMGPSCQFELHRRLAVQRLQHAQPVHGGDVLIPVVVAPRQHGGPQRCMQSRVGGDEAALQIQREQPQRRHLVAVLQLGLRLDALLVLLAHLRGDGHGGQQAGGQCRRDAVDRANPGLQPKGRCHHLIQAGQQHHGNCRAIPGRHRRARDGDDAPQNDHQQHAADDRGHPDQRQKLRIGQRDGQQQQKRAAPLQPDQHP